QVKLSEVLENRALKYAELIVKSTTLAGSGHPSTALSLVHIFSCLNEIINLDAKNPFDRKNDLIILSEGHAVPVQYAAWAVKGINYLVDGKAKQLLPKDLDNLRAIDSPLDGHPNPSVEINGKIVRMPFASATGALGQGLSIANGAALADRLDNIKRKIFVIAGDSEMREGQHDEASRFAATQILSITLIINLNNWGQSEQTKNLVKYNYREEFEAKGWKVLECNGHKVDELMDVLSKIKYDSPTVILAHTIKGWGVSKLQEGNWHGKTLPKELLANALKEITSKETLKITFPNTPSAKIDLSFEPFAGKISPSFSEDKIAPRKAYGYALRDLGQENKNIVVVDAEVSNSTFTEIFRKQFPDRYVECAIAEQNMVGVASGLASQGKIVFANTFGRFLETAFTQFNISCQSKIPLHLVGSHVGLGPHSDGPSQMALADIAYLNSFPNLYVFSASDGISSYKITELCAKLSNPTYQRNYRPEMSLLYSNKENFVVGGSKILKKGKVYIYAHGYMVHVALSVANKLKNIGVVDAYSLKPFDEKTLLNLKPKAVLTLEDNFCGLGNIVASVCARNKIQCEQMFVNKWPKSARKIEEELEYCGLDEISIIKRIKKIIS
ncbi:MAG: transketolase, partial [Nanoarchaeota archaeon]